MAFCCFGADAQVPGGDYSKHALDIGLGLRPDLTGLGHGLDYVRTVIEFGIMRFKPGILRATIASFNLRAQKVWIASGFRECQRFERESDDLEFVVLESL